MPGSDEARGVRTGRANSCDRAGARVTGLRGRPSDMSNEHARQKRLERKRRKREERRRASSARAEPPDALLVAPPMSELLPRFAEPWIARLPADADEGLLKSVLSVAAFVWNGAVVGERPGPDLLAVGRELFRALGWAADFEEEARALGRRRATLFPEERRLFVGVDVARERGRMRVYAASALPSA